MKLKFKVKHQLLTKLNSLTVVEKSRNYLYAHFDFCNDWIGLTKTAVFKKNDNSYTVILENDECLVPWEVLIGDEPFEVSVFSSGEKRITTNTCLCKVILSGSITGESSSEQSKSAYEQLLSKVDSLEAPTIDEDKIVNKVKEQIEIPSVNEDEIVNKVKNQIVVPTVNEESIANKVLSQITVPTINEDDIVSKVQKKIVIPAVDEQKIINNILAQIKPVDTDEIIKQVLAKLDAEKEPTQDYEPAKKTLSILSDSYGTFEGYLDPSTNKSWFPNSNSTNDVSKVEETWWYQFANENDYKIVQNNSYSGAPISYDGYNKTSTSDAKATSFVTRSSNLADADLILVLGGTNDTWIKSEIGEAKYSDWTEDDFTKFKPSVAYVCDNLINKHPNARIIFILNTSLGTYGTAIKEVVAHYDKIELLELKNIDKIESHPSVLGMTQIKDQLVEYLKTNPQTIAEDKPTDQSDRKAMISFIDDDGINRIYEYTGLYSYMKEQQIPMGFAIPWNRYKNGDTSESSGLTLAQLEQLKADGNDILNHLLSSKDAIATSYTDGTLEEKIIESKDIAKQRGFESNIFVYPSGMKANIDEVKATVGKHFDYGININLGSAYCSSVDEQTLTSGNWNSIPLVDKLNIARWQIDSKLLNDSGELHSWVKDRISKAVTAKGYIVFFTHSYSSSFSMDAYKKVVEYCKTLDVDFVTPSEAFKKSN